MLTYVETGTQFTRDFGDINEAYYNSLESVLREMTQLLRKEEPALYPQFRERILQLEAHADYIGWGYGDALREHVRMLEAGVSGKRK
jgi:mRNA-degrading endonuclease YafQ of YafQ-DinJ toxin-antitoxin module